MTEVLRFYDLLGLTRDATTEDIKRTFRKLALTHHPDKGGDAEVFKDINAACTVLSDPDKRNEYDKKLLRFRSRDGVRGATLIQKDTTSQVPAYRRAASDSVDVSAANRGAKRNNSTVEPQANVRPPPVPEQGTRFTRQTSNGYTEQSTYRSYNDIPSDLTKLSVKELKQVLTALNVKHDDCLERADLLARLAQFQKPDPKGNNNNRQNKPYQNSEGNQTSSGTSGHIPAAAAKTVFPAADSSAKPYRVKVVSMGCESVGKSCIIKRFCEGRFVNRYISTIGIDYGVKQVQIEGHALKVNFFDLSGHPDLYDIRSEFYDYVQGVLLVYDVTNRQSFERLSSWIQEAKRHHLFLSRNDRHHNLNLQASGHPHVVLLANKVDLPGRVVTSTDGQVFAAAHGMDYIETSASSGQNIQDAFNSVFKSVISSISAQNRKFETDPRRSSV